tara:strand:- start:242 stop:499 length:258 start_codon:yes stop_codon:yes gene_type:complete
MKRGDLVYIPSEVMLYRYNDKQGVLSDYIKLEKPSSAVIVDSEYGTCSVLFRGQTWFVSGKHVYPLDNNILTEEENGNSQIDRAF